VIENDAKIGHLVADPHDRLEQGDARIRRVEHETCLRKKLQALDPLNS
jgi:hypothetical protein